MSYCRWSERCDWYIYADVHGGLMINCSRAGGWPQNYTTGEIAHCLRCGSIGTIDEATQADSAFLLGIFAEYLAEEWIELE